MKMKGNKSHRGMTSTQSATGTDLLKRSEAQSLLEKCEQCATDLTKKEGTLRRYVYKFLKRGGPAALKVKEAEIRKKICKNSIRHRSTVHRQYFAALMDYSLELPSGEVSELALRQLRTKVLKDACGEVLNKALAEKGSYRKITAKVVVEVAEDLGCLTHRPVGETDGTKATPLSDEGERSSTEPSTEPSPIAGPPSPATPRLDRDKPETPAVDGEVDSPVPDRLQPLVAMVKGRKSDLSFAKRFLELSYMKPELIEALESLSLEQRQEALRLLKNTG